MAEAFEDLAQENEEVAGEEKGVGQKNLEKAVEIWEKNTVELNGVEVPVIDVVVAITKVWAKLGLKFFLIFPRFLASSRAFAMGEKNIQALLIKVYGASTKDSAKWNSGVYARAPPHHQTLRQTDQAVTTSPPLIRLRREAFEELSAALKAVAPPELMRRGVLLGDTQLDAKWGVRTMKELIHHGLQHCQSLSLLTPEELAVAECAVKCATALPLWLFAHHVPPSSTVWCRRSLPRDSGRGEQEAGGPDARHPRGARDGPRWQARAGARVSGLVSGAVGSDGGVVIVRVRSLRSVMVYKVSWYK